MTEVGPVLTEPKVLEALAHPVRLDLLTYLISNGPATASVCARAVGDTPSNCSYHVRTPARPGLVEAADSTDGRERPWRATITGFRIDPDPDTETPEGPGAAAVLAASVSLEQRLLRDHLSRRDRSTPAWRDADLYSTYTLRVTPDELHRLAEQLDALIRPLIAAIRDDPPDGAEPVHLGLYAFPRTGSPWTHPPR